MEIEEIQQQTKYQVAVILCCIYLPSNSYLSDQSSSTFGENVLLTLISPSLLAYIRICSACGTVWLRNLVTWLISLFMVLKSTVQCMLTSVSLWLWLAYWIVVLSFNQQAAHHSQSSFCEAPCFIAKTQLPFNASRRPVTASTTWTIWYKGYACMCVFCSGKRVCMYRYFNSLCSDLVTQYQLIIVNI